MRNFGIRIEHGNNKGLKISDGFFDIGARITTSANRCVLFNVLRNKLYIDFSSLNCADLCCGSGIVGFEFLSFGAKKCLFVDCDRQRLKSVEEAIKKTGFPAETSFAHLPSLTTNESFDLIFFDPPYKNNFCQKTIDMIYNNNLLTNKGILIIETMDEINTEKFKILDIKKLKNNAKFYFLMKK